MSELLSPLRDQLAALRAGTVSSRQLVSESLDAIANAGDLNAFRCTRGEEALAEADEADRRRAAGEDGLLLGVPIAIKDDVDLAGHTTPFGCGGRHAARTADSEVARRLREAGAVIVGKTHTPELGQWPFTEGIAFGATRNPWNLDYSPGGSSGGSAAAVAAGLVPAAIGSDGAGSIRIPASWSHLVGIKPQRGRIGTWPEPEAFFGLTVHGPLARTVGDAALLLDAATGNNPGELHKPPPFDQPLATAAGTPPRRLKIALALRPPFSGAPVRLDPRIAATTRRIAEQLAKLGHTVEEATPRYGLAGLSFVPRSMHGVRVWTRQMQDPHELDPRTQNQSRTGALLGGPALKFARWYEGPLQRQIGSIYKRYDVVLTPTTALQPSGIGTYDDLSAWSTDQRMIGHCPYAWVWNVTGWPAISVPAGLIGDNLPVGAMLLGPANSEPLLVSLAAELETVERWYEKRPAWRAQAPLATA